MANFVQVNFFKTTIAAAITSSDTSISLGSTTGAPTIPSGDYWPLVLESNGVYELVYGTALSGSTLTVLRGQEGSTAQSWVSGTTIMGAFSSGSMFYVGQTVADSQVPESAVMQYSAQKQVFTSSGTFTATYAGNYLVRAKGGGGGGGAGGHGSTTTNGLGGGGGTGGAAGEEVWQVVALTAGQDVTVTIGTGGIGGVGNTADAVGPSGADGTNTTFGSLVTATGGKGGGGGVLNLTTYGSSTGGSNGGGSGGGLGGTATSSGNTPNAGANGISDGAGGGGGGGACAAASEQAGGDGGAGADGSVTVWM